MNDLFKEKKPSSILDKYIGIEIECLSFYSQEYIAKIFTKYKLNKYVQISRDGSIKTLDHIKLIEHDIYDNNIYHNVVSIYDEDDDREITTAESFGYEFKICCKQKELKYILIKLGKVLNEIEAFTNRSCGLHVHLDMRNRDPIKCALNICNIQPLILRSIPLHRRHNTFCLPINDGHIQDLKRGILNINKYHLINTERMEDLKTIEIRIHEGTINTIDIYKWCKFLIEIIESDINKPIRTSNSLSFNMKKYIKERIKYAGRN